MKKAPRGAFFVGAVGDDLFQPPDRQALVADPGFCFEDGLDGYLAVRAALRASR